MYSHPQKIFLVSMPCRWSCWQKKSSWVDEQCVLESPGLPQDSMDSCRALICTRRGSHRVVRDCTHPPLSLLSSEFSAHHSSGNTSLVLLSQKKRSSSLNNLFPEPEPVQQSFCQALVTCADIDTLVSRQTRHTVHFLHNIFALGHEMLQLPSLFILEHWPR